MLLRVSPGFSAFLVAFSFSAAAVAAGDAKDDAALRVTGPAQVERRDAFSQKQAPTAGCEATERKREEQIKEIKALVEKVRGKPQEGELVFRLAEIYWALSKCAYDPEFRAYDDAYNKWVDGGRDGKEPELAAYTKRSDAFKRQALDNYQRILAEFPEYPRLDEVLYIMAFNQQEAGKEKEAVDNYSQLIRQYPDSEYVSDSYVQLGEYYFKHNDLPKSTKAYARAYDVATKCKGEQTKDHKRRCQGTATFAYYKLGWCDYNAQAYDDALKKFKDVISRQQGDSDIRLKREALNDIVLTYSQLDQVKDAYDYIKSQAGADDAYRLTTKLAGIYKEQGKRPLQIDTLRLLLSLDPDVAQAPDFQSSIVEAYAGLADHESVKAEVARLVELYRPGAPWWRKNDGNKAITERALALAESRVRALVTDYHQHAQKHKKYTDYDTAVNIYSQYLKAFPDAQAAYRLRFFYAELLWDLGKWHEAAAEYDAVVKRDPKGEFTRNSAYAAVLAWEKIVNKIAPPLVAPDGTVQIDDCAPDDEAAGKCKVRRIQERVDTTVVLLDLKKQKQGDHRFDPQEIPADEVSLAAACDAYVAVVPDNEADPKLKEELQKVKFKAAYIYQSHFHFDDGAQRFGELIARWPDSKYARDGADQILDSYAFRGDYPALEKWSRDFAARKELMADGKFAKSVRDLMEGATFKNTDALRAAAEKSHDPEQAVAAAAKLDAFTREFPKSQYAALAVFDMQLLFANVRHEDEALAAAQRLLTEYPKEIAAYKLMKNTGELDQDLGNKLEKETYANMPAYYEKTASYREAADWYVKFADKYKDDAHAPDSVYNAGVFYLGLGDSEQAVKMFTRYIKDFPKQKDNPDVYLQMTAVYEDKDDYKRAAALYGDFAKLWGKQASPEQVLSSQYKTALMLQKAGRDKDMLTACNEIIAQWPKLEEKLRTGDVGALAGGYCAFHLLETDWLAYKAIKIEQNGAVSGRRALQVVGQALDLKKRKRDELAKKYFDVKDYGNAEWAIAGLLRAADAFLEHAETLRNTPDPASLSNNPEAIELFRSELEGMAFAVDEEAIKALEAALSTAFEKGIYSQYTIEIEERLKRFQPSKFGHIYELPFFPSAGGSLDAGRVASLASPRAAR